MLDMVKCDTPVKFSPDGEVVPKGFGPLAINFDIKCPVQILDEDSDHDVN